MKKNKNISVVLILFGVWLAGTYAVADETYLDKFDSVAYNNNDGTKNFANDWSEQGDDGSASGGDILVSNSGFLQFNGIDDNDGISRKLDLSWVS
jgi:hypothetical protein